MWKGTGDEGSDVADRTVMTSGLSSAFSSSDINILFTVMLHMTSMTPAQQTGKRSVSEVSPRNHKNNIQLSFSLSDSDGGIRVQSVCPNQKKIRNLNRKTVYISSVMSSSSAVIRSNLKMCPVL